MSKETYLTLAFLTKGINVVRVARDEAYIDKMLAFARIFHAAFTLKGQVSKPLH